MDWPPICYFFEKYMLLYLGRSVMLLGDVFYSFAGS